MTLFKHILSCSTTRHLLLGAGCLCSQLALAQAPARQDTLNTQTLDSITVIARLQPGVVQTLATIHGTYMYGAKKTEVTALVTFIPPTAALLFFPSAQPCNKRRI